MSKIGFLKSGLIELLSFLFQEKIVAYIAVFFVSVFYINFSPMERSLLLEAFYYPILITVLYWVIAGFIKIFYGSKFNSIPMGTTVSARCEYRPNRETMSENELNHSSLHEAAHFVSLLRMDFNRCNTIRATLHRVTYEAHAKQLGSSLESIFDIAFFMYLPLVAERKYYTSSWDTFTHGKDLEKFETYARTYLIRSSEHYFFVNPVNDIEAAHNAKMLEEFKKMIDTDCTEFLEKNVKCLEEAIEILKQRDIETLEAKELLNKYKIK